MPIERSTATPDDIERYTAGECHVFALALSRLTGWPIKLVLDYHEPYWISDDGEDSIPNVVHAYCIDPNDNAWDVIGVRRLDGVKAELEDQHHIQEYGSDEIRSEDELRYYCGCWSDEGDEIDRPLVELREEDLAEAREDIGRILADLLHQRYPAIVVPEPAASLPTP